jgi:hypothetical protein
VQRANETIEGELPQAAPVAARAYKEEIVIPFKVAGAYADHGLHDHVAQEVQPKTALMFHRQRAKALVTRDRLPEKCGIMETAEQ